MDKTLGETMMLEMSKDSGWLPMDSSIIMADELDNEIVTMFSDDQRDVEYLRSSDDISRQGSSMATGQRYVESYWTLGASNAGRPWGPNEISHMGSIVATGQRYAESNWTSGASSANLHNSENNMFSPQNAGATEMRYEARTPGNILAMGYEAQSFGNDPAGQRAGSGQFGESGGRGFAPLPPYGGDYPIGTNPQNQLQQSSSQPQETGRRRRRDRPQGGHEGEGRGDLHSPPFPGEGRRDNRHFSH